MISLVSAIPMTLLYITYFYLLVTFPAHLVLAAYQLSSVWLMLIGLLFGGSITPLGIVGIFVLLYGTYILDVGTFKWKIPTKLLLYSLPSTLVCAIAFYMVRVASQYGSAIAVSFWQLLGLGISGIVMFLLVKRYRAGLLGRIQNQGKVFLGLSLVNEVLAEGALLFGNLSTAIAPVAAYIPALSGVQSLFLMFLFFIFPQGKRTKTTKIQWFAVGMITAGVYLIEYYK